MIEWKGERYYRLKELPAILQKSRTQIYDDVRAGRINSLDVLGVTHVAESEIDRLLGVVKAGPVEMPRAQRTQTAASKKAEERLKKAGW